VFVRGAAAAPLRHVGSVSAPTDGAAHERATTLFARDATDVWLCPADAVSRYSIRPLDDRRDPGAANAGMGEECTDP
jgi:rSAM-partnered protein